MQSLNRWCGIGRLGRDPEVKTTQTGIDVCSFSIACERRKGKDQDKAEVDWIDCQCWKGSADYLAQYGHKDDQVAVDGRLRHDSYQKRDGSTGQKYVIQCDSLWLISKSKSSGTVAEHQNAPQATETGQISTESSGCGTYYRKDIKAQEGSGNATDEISSDDLPF